MLVACEPQISEDGMDAPDISWLLTITQSPSNASNVLRVIAQEDDGRFPQFHGAAVCHRDPDTDTVKRENYFAKHYINGTLTVTTEPEPCP